MSAKLSFKYANPHLDVEPGTVRDPFIFKVGELYDLTGKLRAMWAGLNAGLPLCSSRDLLNWKNLGLVVYRNITPAETWNRDHWWAPEIYHASNWFYLAFGCRNETTRYKHGVAIWCVKPISGPHELSNLAAPFPPV